jgi:hypothetical protein
MNANARLQLLSVAKALDVIHASSQQPPGKEMSIKIICIQVSNSRCTPSMIVVTWLSFVMLNDSYRYLHKHGTYDSGDASCTNPHPLASSTSSHPDYTNDPHALLEESKLRRTSLPS